MPYVVMLFAEIALWPSVCFFQSESSLRCEVVLLDQMMRCCAFFDLAWVDFAVGASLSGTMLASMILDFVIINV